MEKQRRKINGNLYCEYLKGKYFGILGDCEKKRDYEPLIESLLVELLSLIEDFNSDNLYKLYAKTASLKFLRYKYLRKTILKDCMPLVEKIFKVGIK